jgi:hypothetical protein
MDRFTSFDAASRDLSGGETSPPEHATATNPVITPLGNIQTENRAPHPSWKNRPRFGPVNGKGETERRWVWGFHPLLVRLGRGPRNATTYRRTVS